MMNKIILHGRLTKDPDYSEASNGVMMAKFTVAVDRDYKAKNEETRKADFFSCVAWRGTADLIGKWFKKGQEIVICGSMQSYSWMDDSNNKRTGWQVVVSSVDFAGSRHQQSDGEASPTVPEVKQSEFYELEDDDSDLPF